MRDEPDFRRKTHDGKEETGEVEHRERAVHAISVEGERDFRHGQIEYATDDVAFLHISNPDRLPDSI